LNANGRVCVTAAFRTMFQTRGGEPAAPVNIWHGPHQNFRHPI